MKAHGPYRRPDSIPREIVDAFGLDQQSATRLQVGHINESFVVAQRSGVRLLVQSINHDVFTQPEQVMQNLERVLEAGGAPRLQLEPPCSGDHRHGAVIDAEHRWWRAFHFLSDVVALTVPRHLHDVRATARAFGAFQRRLRDLDPSSLHETIPRFHDTPHRYRQLDQAVSADAHDRLEGCTDLVELAEEQRPIAQRLTALQQSGAAPLRAVHNDAKISNVLFDAETDATLTVVDLDTVMPGLALHDFGDMVRSMAHTAEEDERDLARVFVQPELYRALADGYLEEAGDFLTAAERECLYDAGLVLILEQAVRFLSDHLQGDRYFRVHRENHNLDRSRNQFRLLESLLEHEDELRSHTLAS